MIRYIKTIALFASMLVATNVAMAQDASEVMNVAAADAETEVTMADSVKPKEVATFESMNTTMRGWGFGLRAGFTIGGTSPFPLPQEIRELRSFGPNGALMEEIYVYHLFNQRWGIYMGERLAWEGMKTAAVVKNYKMSIVQDGEKVSGYYTGVDETNSSTVSIKMPIEAMFRVSPRWDLRLGPYFQFNMKSSFDGKVYEGYLRENDPTGQKIGFEGETSAPYDFSDEIRPVLIGMELAADCKITKHFGVFANLDWGLNSIFPDDFQTITFDMYPIYFSLGVFVGF